MHLKALSVKMYKLDATLIDNMYILDVWSNFDSQHVHLRCI